MSLSERVLTEEYMGDNVSDTEEASCVPNTSHAVYEAVEYLFMYTTSRNLKIGRLGSRVHTLHPYRLYSTYHLKSIDQQANDYPMHSKLDAHHEEQLRLYISSLASEGEKSSIFPKASIMRWW
jgi:hypothetical protein